MARSKVSIERQIQATKMLGGAHLDAMKAVEGSFLSVSSDIGDAWGHHWQSYADRLIEALVSFRLQVEARLEREKVEASREIERPSMPRRGIPKRL